MATPTLGYASRTEAVQALRAQGKRTAEIARLVGIEPKTVSALEASSRRWREPGSSTAKQHTVVFDNDVLRALRPHAAKRSMTTNALARLIVATVVDEGMVDAVLDDDGGRS